jgi:hypothetical protein
VLLSRNQVCYLKVRSSKTGPKKGGSKMTTLRHAAIAATIYTLAFMGSLEALPMDKSNMINKENRMKAVATLTTAIRKRASVKSARSTNRVPRSGCLPNGICVLNSGPTAIIYKEASSSASQKHTSIPKKESVKAKSNTGKKL